MTQRRAQSSAVLENFYERASGDPDQLEIWGYTDRLSYEPGDTVRFHVSTTAPTFGLQIIRDGWQPEVVFTRRGLPGTLHPTPADCSVRGCGWPVAYEFTVPPEWHSGGYVVKTVTETGGHDEIEHHGLFVVRPTPDRTASPILLVAATSTWLAYNDWGGSNAYEGITGPDRDQYSPILSTQRPFSRGFVWLPEGAPRVPLPQAPEPGAATRYPHMEWAYANGFSKKYASAGWASYERHFVRWAEANDYRFDLATQHDLQFRPEILDRYRCVAIVGHDEYWSWEMRDAIDRYVEAGGRVARFAGNFFWQIRLEDEGRTQVCYKYRARDEDPLFHSEDRHLTTTLWESLEVARPGARTFGLNGTRGVYAGWGACCPRGSGGFTVYRPEHWVFEGTDLHYGDVFGGEARIFGYEVDGLDYVVRNGLPWPTHEDGAPEGIEILAMGLATLIEEDHGNPGGVLFIGDSDVRFVAEAIYGDAGPDAIDRLKRGSGMIAVMPRGTGTVFNAGTCEWVAGLTRRDPFVDRITRNVLDTFLKP